MRLNERLYDELGYLPYEEPKPGEDYVPKEATPFEVQQEGEHTIELYYMNEHEDVLREYTQRNKFAVWSSKNGKDYRLAVEKGYYEKLSDLYSAKVNSIWINFWDRCDIIQKNFSFKFMIPSTVIVIALFLFLVNIGRIFNVTLPSWVSTVITLSVPIAYIIFVMLIRRRVISKISMEQAKAIQEIKDHFGDNKFELLLKEQRTYIDEFFANQASEEKEEETEDASETKIEEAAEAKNNENEKLELDETKEIEKK